ncbi:MAG: methionyl-tRNA formyltransferase [bacterium]|nr:methionyl-tRNA formyltransferase [bacterium]
MTKNTSKFQIIFIGTPDFSVPTLQALINDERFNVAAVVTAPDAKVGRKQILTPPPVKVAAGKNNIPVLQPASLKADKRLSVFISELNPDIIITIAYGQILPRQILDLPKHGCLNLHASLLPKYRGASPIQSAVAAGDAETGVTLMKMDAGCDTGPIIAQEKINLKNDETGESLHDRLSQLSAEVIIKYLEDYLLGKLRSRAQNESTATKAAKLTRASGKINWNKSAAEIERLTRAYYPWPGAWFFYNNKKLKIIKVDNQVLNANENEIGTLFIYNKQLAAQCGQNALIINKLQPEGKKVMSGEEFLKGHKL